MNTITLFSNRQRIECSDPVYYARHDDRAPGKHVPSHLVAWPSHEQKIDEICYVQLIQDRVPVLVTAQPDGSIWLGGAYLDTIAGELRLIPRLLPMKEPRKYGNGSETPEPEPAL